MPYTRNPMLVRAMKGAWLNVEELQGFIATAEMNSFTYVNARQSTIELWGKLSRKAPCTPDKRFGDWDCYVYIDDGDWPGKITQMLTSLNYKEASEQGQINNQENDTGKTETNGRKKTGNGPSSSTVEESQQKGEGNSLVGQNQHEKALLGFFTAMRRMKDQLAKGDNVFEQETFEKKFEATWTA